MMMKRVLNLSVLVGMSFLAIGTTQLPAQVNTVHITEPDATFPESFGMVRGLRELADGRVMIADPMGQALVIADLAAGTADTLGGVGQGPQEYQQPDGLFPLPGDSTLLIDLGNARLTALGPNGEFGETMPISRSGSGPGGMLMVIPRAVDARGRLYIQPFGGGRGGLPDSAAVVRFDRASEAMDTVAMVKAREMKRSESGGPNNQDVQIRPVPYSPQGSWAVSPDGRIAVVRAPEYRVDWFDGDGMVQGTTVDYEPVRIGSAEKERYLDDIAANGLSVSVQQQNDRVQTSFRRGGGRRGSADAYEWPEVMPAFDPGGTRVTPEGELWVERHVAAGEPPTFDVFGADGNLKGRVVLPEGRQLVGFGEATLYLVRVDEYDLHWLERYRRTT